jgi:hypothetical protein
MQIQEKSVMKFGRRSGKIKGSSLGNDMKRGRPSARSAGRMARIFVRNGVKTGASFVRNGEKTGTIY